MRRFWQDMAGAATTTATAFVARLALERWLQGEAPFLMFTLSVLASSLLGGLRAGLAATVLGGALAALAFAETANIALHLALFLTIGVSIAILVQVMRQARQAAEVSEQYLSRILETAQDGILVFDRDGYITFANPAAGALFGLTAGHMIGRAQDDPGWGFAWPDGRRVHGDALPVAQALRSRQSLRGLRLMVRGADDLPRQISVNAGLLRDKEDAVTGVVVSLTDLTDRAPQTVEAVA